jgi:radical SAM superfamily enzyme YgiQ (UPF0313 family)
MDYSLPKAIMDPLVQKVPSKFIMNHSDFPILMELIKTIKAHGYEHISFSEGLFPLLFEDFAHRAFETAEDVSTRYETLLEFVRKSKEQLGSTFEKIGFSVFYLNVVETALLSLLLKLEYPEIQIIWGGPAITQSSDAFKRFLKEGVCDGLVIGEGEYPLLQFVNDIPLQEIAGVMSYRKKEHTYSYQQGIQLDLDLLPTPDYTGIDLEPYFNIASVYRSRGCTHRCKFCGEWFLFGNKFRVRSVEKVIKDIEIIIENHNPGYIIFGESLINDDLDYFERLCDELIAKDFDINFGTHFRANITPELARKAYQAGFNDAWIGVEALNDDELKAMNKGKTANQNIEVIDHFTQARINVLAMLVVGFADREIEEKNCRSIIKLIEYLSKKRVIIENGKQKKIPIQFKPAPMFLVPGSFEYLQKKNILTSSWKLLPPKGQYQKKKRIGALETILKDIPYEFQRAIADTKVGELTKRIIDAERSAGFAVSGISGYVIRYLMNERRKKHSSKIIGTIAQKFSS